MLREHTIPALEVGAKRGGRTLDDVRIGAGIFTAVDADRAIAMNRIKHQIIWALNIPYNQPLLAQAGFPGVTEAILAALDRNDKAAAIAAIPDDLVHEVSLCGTPDDIRSRLNDWSELVESVSFNGIGAYMNVAPEGWRLPPEELARNRQAVYDLLPLP
jgi:alkanesulfonate monooxygenase SsuD/methylene tetrahydromethanopterin reductase-like flavin-dependent oxidoreductase (luciferase family)